MKNPFSVSPERKRAFAKIRSEIPGYEGKAQQRRILAAIQTLGSVTTFEAMRFLDVYDPRPRKLELCKQGHPILLCWDRTETEAGEVHRVGRYFLATGQKKGAAE
jgi:hypothetical protein